MIRRDVKSSEGDRRTPHVATERVPQRVAAGVPGAHAAEHWSAGSSGGDRAFVRSDAIPALRKAAILLVSLDQSLASAILAHLSKEQVEAVTLEIAQLEQVTPEEQTRVWQEFYEVGWGRLQFGFDDVGRLSTEDLRVLFDEVVVEQWVLSLVGAPREVREAILGKLPAARAHVLESRLEGLGPFRLGDAESAQAAVVERVLELADEGVITLPMPGRKEDVLV
jgi:flagellar motor switch protein FliG